MSYSLTYNDLPAEIYQWPGLPLSLSGDEIMPLDYRAGHTGWLLYGNALNKHKLAEFQQKLDLPLVVVTAWCVGTYQVIRLAGALPARAKTVADALKLDTVPLDDVPNLLAPGLLVMDMDSTAITIECIDEIAKLAGTGNDVSAITERAMRGELDFAASLRQRVATLKGADIAILEQVKKSLPLMSGLEFLVSELHKQGWYVAIASGGFTYYADYLREKLDLIDVVANRLEIKEGKLTGNVLEPIVDAKYKADTLLNLAERLEIPLSQTVAIGDGANDLAMIKVAQLGIAYHAKPTVVAKAQASIHHADLIGVLCILSGSLKHEER